MPFDDPSDGTTPTAQDAVAPTSAPVPDASVSNTPPVATAAPTAANQPTQPNQTVQAQPTHQQPPTQPTQANQTVSNAAQHPSVQRASVLRDVAETLAGGPRYTVSIDPVTGTTTRTKVPLSKGDILTAIAMEAISGSLAGLDAKGPNAVGQAAGLGLQQGQRTAAQRQQAQQIQEQQARQDAANQKQALVRQAQNAEIASRTILNTAQAERMGVENMKDAIAANAQLLSDYNDAGSVLESHVDQDTLLAGMKSGKYTLANVAIPDGIANLNGRPEQTFSIIKDAHAKVPLSQEQAQELGDNAVPGFTPFKTGGSKIPDWYQVPGVVLANANAQATANKLMLSEVRTVSDALSKSGDKGNQQLAATIPDFKTLLSDPDQGPQLQSALAKFQKYVSHSDLHGLNFYQSLQQMASASMPDPRNPKQVIPNPASRYAQTIAGAFGNGDPQKGWQILKAYSDATASVAVKNENDAYQVISDPDSTPRAKAAARNFLAVQQQNKAANAGAEARARKAVEGTGTGAGTPDVQEVADAIATGRGTFEQLTQGMGKEAATFRRQVETDLLKRYPNVNIGALKAFSSQANNAGTQSQITNARALFGANGQPGSFDQIEDLLRAVPKAPLPFLSKLGQHTAYQLGSPQMAEVYALKTDIASDLAKFNTGGGAHSSDHQIELYREQLNEAQTPEQIATVLKGLRSVSSKRLNGIVGPNPYLASMTADINDPVSKQPRGNGGQRQANQATGNAGTQPKGNVIPAGAQPVQVNGKTTGYVLNGRYSAFGVQ